MADTTPLPWPKLTDTLFVDDAPDWKNNACLNYGISDYAYIEGYRRGADALVRQIEDHPVDQDGFVYPIVFGYRQYLELKMKALRRDGFDLFGWTMPTRLNHDLVKVWADCRKVIEELFPTEPTDDIDAAEKLITEYNAMDPDSFAFRYATSKTGQPALPTTVRMINLRHLRETMEGLAMFLDAAGAAVADALDNRP